MHSLNKSTAINRLCALPSRRTTIPILMMVRELDIGGIERDVTRTVLALDLNIFEPHVAAFYPQGIRYDELRCAGIPVLNLPVRNLLSPTTLRFAGELRTYLRKHEIKVFHAWDNSALFGMPIAMLSNVPVLVSSVLGHRSLTDPKTVRLLHVTDHLADAIVTNCDFLKTHLVNEENVPPAKVHVCYNGVDTNVFSPVWAEAEPPPASLGITIGTVSCFRPIKNLALLLSAFARVKDQHCSARLLIVGGGPCYPALRASRDRLSLEESCLFVPVTTDVVGWLRAIDIFVLPSQSEGMSNALLEAMACGCAVVATAVGGTPELLGRNERGLLCRPDDVEDLASKIDHLVRNPALRRQLGMRAARFVRDNLSVGESVSRISAIYLRLLLGDRQ